MSRVNSSSPFAIRSPEKGPGPATTLNRLVLAVDAIVNAGRDKSVTLLELIDRLTGNLALPAFLITAIICRLLYLEESVSS
jgi:hypothetical protein